MGSFGIAKENENSGVKEQFIKHRNIMSKRWHPTGGNQLNMLSVTTGFDGNHFNQYDGASSACGSVAGSTITTTPPFSATRSKKVKLEFSKEIADDDRSPTSSSATPCSHSTTTLSSSCSSFKPPSSRILLERDPMTKLMESHIFCPLCSNPVVVSFPSIGIASCCRIQCSSDLCNYIQIDRPRTCDVDLPEGSGSPLIERTTDYPANVLYILSLLACGDGGKEGERILGFLGLPNSTTMEKRTFPVVEERLSATIQGVTNDICKENLSQAVKNFYGDRKRGDDLLFALWEQQVSNPTEVILDPQEFPRLMASTDMAWQKRSSGHRYDSMSGDAFLIESQTRLPIFWCVKSKLCSVCQRHKHGATAPVRPHACRINHEGSAGSMEPLAVLDMVIEAYDNFVVIDTLITDDDSSMKAKLKWSNDDYMLNTNTTERPKIVNKNGNLYRPNHGALTRHIPEPKFMADPNHRKKTLNGELYRHFKKRKAERSGLTKVDILRIVTNFAYMVRTLHATPVEDHPSCGKAVVEHHFDNHEDCGDFCKRKALSATEKAASKKVYRNKEKDEDLYKFLTATVARFITPDALKEVAHGSDTQVNESLNNSVTWFAQKNKTYAATSSLANRVCLALGIYSVGYEVFFVRLFERCGINIPDDLRYYLKKQEKTRVYRKEKDKKSEIKKKRNAKLHGQLKELSQRMQDGAQGGAQYNPGIGMDGGYYEEDAKPAAVLKCGSVCTSCGKNTHKRSTNKLCVNYTGGRRPRRAAPTSLEQIARDGHEQSLLDEVGFDLEAGEQFFDSFEMEEDLVPAGEDEGAPVVRTSCII